MNGEQLGSILFGFVFRAGNCDPVGEGGCVARQDCFGPADSTSVCLSFLPSSCRGESALSLGGRVLSGGKGDLG